MRGGNRFWIPEALKACDKLTRSSLRVSGLIWKVLVLRRSWSKECVSMSAPGMAMACVWAPAVVKNVIETVVGS